MESYAVPCWVRGCVAVTCGQDCNRIHAEAWHAHREHFLWPPEPTPPDPPMTWTLEYGCAVCCQPIGCLSWLGAWPGRRPCCRNDCELVMCSQECKTKHERGAHGFNKHFLGPPDTEIPAAVNADGTAIGKWVIIMKNCSKRGRNKAYSVRPLLDVHTNIRTFNIQA